MRDELVKLQKDVQDWSIEDLRFANKVVVAEINEQLRKKTLESISKFRIGQRVKFVSKYGRFVEGTIEKINRRTVSLESCTDGKHWRVGNLDKLEVVS